MVERLPYIESPPCFIRSTVKKVCMAFEALPTSQFDALPLSDNRSSGPNSLDLQGQRPQTLQASARVDVTDSSGAVQFPSVYGNRQPVEMAAAQPAQPGQPAQAGAPPSETHDHTVKSGESLWRIAKESLTHGDRHVHVNGEQIWQRIHDIVEANKNTHSEIRSNPFFITKGEHLIIPGADYTPVAQPYNSKRGGGHIHGYHPIPQGLSAAENHSGSENSAPSTHGRSRTVPGAEAPYSPASAAAGAQPIADGGHLAKAIKGEACHQAQHIDTVGDCARGPRQTLEQFGIKLRPMPATAQGEILEKSGLFDRVSADDVKPGDYGYRHWSTATIKRRGLGDLGDSFIVTDCTRKGWQAANDHMFTVPPAGGYYAPGITFLRPNAKFYAAYEHYKETGEMTVIKERPKTNS